jgi:competence protein ComGF
MDILVKIKASSLFETLIAMVIICIILVIATSTLVSFQENNKNLINLELISKIDSTLFFTSKENYLDDIVYYDKFILIKKYSVNREKNHVELNLTILDINNRKILYERKSILKIDVF